MSYWPALKRESVQALRTAGSFAVDVVYPKRCAGCGRRGPWLCPRCDADLVRFAPPWCQRCGVPIALNACHCDRMPEALEAARSVGPFAGWLRGAIVQCKYHGEWDRATFLGPAIAHVIGDLLPCDALVPVPLHRSRLKQRGFNQSLLVAQAAAANLSLDVLDVLERTRQTYAQVQLGAVQRHLNVEGAFHVRQDAMVQGLRLILIDDVITTGSTLAACASSLLASGAERVAVATIAREF